MKVTNYTIKLLTYLNSRPAKTASYQEIIIAMAKNKGPSHGVLAVLLQSLVTSNQITHTYNADLISGTKVHKYTAV